MMFGKLNRSSCLFVILAVLAPPLEASDLVENGLKAVLQAAKIKLSQIHAANVAANRIMVASGRRSLVIDSWWLLWMKSGNCYSSIVSTSGETERGRTSCTRKDGIFDLQPIGSITFDIDELSECLARHGRGLLVTPSGGYTLLRENFDGQSRPVWSVSLLVDAHTCEVLDPLGKLR